MSNSEVKIQIPDQLVSTLIHAEIAQALSNKPALIEAAVREMLSVRSDNYNRETLFAKMVKEMIKAEAKTILGEWIEKNKSDIRKALFNELNKGKQKKMKEVCDSIISGMTSYTASVSLRIFEDRK